jgi:hypothetical protein
MQFQFDGTRVSLDQSPDDRQTKAAPRLSVVLSESGETLKNPLAHLGVDAGTLV